MLVVTLRKGNVRVEVAMRRDSSPPKNSFHSKLVEDKLHEQIGLLEGER